MKATKRLLAVLLALVLLCIGVPFAAQAEGETSYQVGDLIQFGNYPQTRVDETPELKAAVDAAVWASYKYYTGTGSNSDGKMKPSDYMRFADFYCDEGKYRAVTFNTYRPQSTGDISNPENSWQDDNGYYVNQVYYFKYEPLIWRILDPSSGLIICESIIDSQAFQNTIYLKNSGSDVSYQSVTSSVYSNDYSKSSIRDWLNNVFFTTSFSDSQKLSILSTTLNNSAYNENYNQYDSASTTDKLYLLSFFDVTNRNYGFSSSSSQNKSRIANNSTDYAKCQGLYVSKSEGSVDNSFWRLRSPGGQFGGMLMACSVNPKGSVIDDSYLSTTSRGIRPACCIAPVKNNNDSSSVLFSLVAHKQQGHVNGAVVKDNEIPSTCTQKGSYDEVVYCTECGEELSRTPHETTMLNHTPGETVIENEVAATCKSEGSYDEVVYCTVCGAEISREIKTIEKLPHTEQTYTTPSTCAENGFTITICTRCGETLSKEILPRLDHNWTSEVTQNPTCTAQGVKTYTCESCGETYTEPVDVLAHEWDDGKITKASSCTEEGEMTYTCATGGETRTEPIDKLDHEIVLVKGKAASCTEPGLTDGWQCSMCKKWFAEQQEIAALDHDPQIGKVVEATCEEPGYTPFICTRCGETVRKTDPTDALGHNMQPTYVWAKDDSTVTATMICTRCEAIGATETAEVKTEITVKPTCSTEGELTLIAAFNNKSFYGQSKTKTLPRDPDAHVFKVTVTPPTCVDEGYTTHACTLCRYGYSDEIVSALGHDYQHHDAKAPTCEAPGWDAYDTCSRCDYTTYSELATVDHDDADNDGKCDMCGDQMRGGSHCKYCGKVHNGNFFDKLTGFFHRILAIFKR